MKQFGNDLVASGYSPRFWPESGEVLSMQTISNADGQGKISVSDFTNNLSSSSPVPDSY